MPTSLDSGFVPRLQVLFLDVRKDAEHDRLLAFAQLVRQHMQQAGKLLWYAVL